MAEIGDTWGWFLRVGSSGPGWNHLTPCNPACRSATPNLKKWHAQFSQDDKSSSERSRNHAQKCDWNCLLLWWDAFCLPFWLTSLQMPHWLIKRQQRFKLNRPTGICSRVVFAAISQGHENPNPRVQTGFAWVACPTVHGARVCPKHGSHVQRRIITPSWSDERWWVMVSSQDHHGLPCTIDDGCVSWRVTVNDSEWWRSQIMSMMNEWWVMIHQILFKCWALPLR